MVKRTLASLLVVTLLISMFPAAGLTAGGEGPTETPEPAGTVQPSESPERTPEPTSEPMSEWMIDLKANQSAYDLTGGDIISEEGIYDIDEYGDGSILINAGLAVTLTNTKNKIFSNMQIICGSGVALTIDNVQIDNSINANTCALSFSGVNNSLVLEGNSSLISGDIMPGISVKADDSLVITGTGSVIAVGGSGAAGIGGGYGNDGGSVSVEGGIVYAQKGSNANYDIGDGQNGDGGTLSIQNDAIVFLKNGVSESTLAPAHTLMTAEALVNGKAFGLGVPDSWSEPVYIYLNSDNLFELSYNANGGEGTAPETIMQYMNTTIAVDNGNGITKAGHTLTEWNTKADEAGDGYDFGDSFIFTSNTILYAVWDTEEYTVTFNSQDGSEVQSVETEYNTTISPPPVPTKAGATFGGWYKDEACTESWRFDTDRVVSDITLYSKWNVINSNNHIIEQEDFIPLDMVASLDGTVVYMTGTNNSYVYRYDTLTGGVTALPVPYPARKLCMSPDGVLFVTLSNPTTYTDTVGVIDPDDFSLTTTFDVSLDGFEYYLTGVEADNNYIFAYHRGGANVYSRTSNEFLFSSRQSFDDLQVNPLFGKYYGYADILISYTIVDGQLVTEKYDTTYYGSDLNILIMPDGQHLMLSDGTILTCSERVAEDLVYTTKLQHAGKAAVDAATNELYVSCNRIIYVYDASDFSFKRAMTEPALTDYLLCSGGTLIYGQGNSDGDMVMHSVCPGTLLKTLLINGEPFTEFYPTYMNIDRGEVPNAMSSVNITAIPAQNGAAVSGDTGIQPLSVGENVFNVTVTDQSGKKSETYSISFTRLENNPVVEHIAFDDIGFTPNDMALDPDRSVAYLTAVGGNCLYRVDLVTGEIQQKEFDIEAQRLTVVNGKVYVTLVRGMTHSPYINDGFGYAGAVAVIDAASFKIENIFEIMYMAIDIEADNAGRALALSATDSYTILMSYDSGNGRNLSAQSSIRTGNIDYNQQTNKVYFISSNSSPMEIEAFEVTDGVITDHYDSRYHGDYSLTYYMQVSPDGQYIFNGSGDIFKCSPERNEDIVYNGYSGSSFSSICFDPNKGMYYTSASKTLKAFDYSRRIMKYSYTSTEDFISIFLEGSDIIALQKKSTGEYHINRISTEKKNADLSAINITSGILSPTFDPEATSYSLLLDAQTEAVIITPVMSDAEASYNIEGVTNMGKAISLDKGDSTKVTITGTSSDGTAKRSYIIRIYRHTDDGTFISNPDYLGIYNEETSDKDCYDKAVDPSLPAIYLTNNLSFIYKIDKNGIITALPLPDTAQHLGYADGMLLVSMENTAFNKYTVGVVDPVSFTLTDTFDTEVLYTAFAGDADNIYACDEDNIYVHSKDTFEMTSSIHIIEPYILKVNKVNGKLYATSHWGITSYTITDGIITKSRSNDSTYMISGMEIMPDGHHLILSNGYIFSCSAMAEQDLIYTMKLPVDWRPEYRWEGMPVVDETTNEIYISDNWLINVYDASNFNFKRVVPEPLSVSYLHNGKSMFMFEDNQQGNIVIRSTNPDTLLKTLLINGEPFSEFFPTRTIYDRGQVPNAMTSVNITALAAQDGAVVSGDTGVQPLSVGENVFTITVADPASGESETYSITLTRCTNGSSPSTYNALVNLGFTPVDMALDPDRSVAYMTAADGYSLYRIDLETGYIQKKVFDLKVERLTVANNKVYITLLRQEHTSAGSTYSNGNGAIAVVDTATFLTENIFNINLDPYDIEADALGNVYIAPGSGQWSVLSEYDSSNGRHILDSHTVYYKGYIDGNAQMNRIYYIDKSSTSRGMEAFQITDGVITDHYSWPYSWGNYGLTGDLCVSPDGQYIFNGSGNVFKCTATRAGDMAYDGNIGSTFKSICFDIPNNRFYTSSGTSLKTYEYNTRTLLNSQTINGEFIALQHNGDNIIALIKSSGQYYITRNFLGADNADVRDIKLTNGTLSPSFHPDLYDYTVTLGSAVSATVITPVKSNSLATLSIDGVINANKTVTLIPGGTCDVLIEVTAQDGFTKKEYTVHVSREGLPSANADLSGITVSTGAVSPEFYVNTVEYSIDLPYTISSTTIIPIKADSTATLRIDGTIATSKTISVETGRTKDVRIDVTAQDGVTKKTYTVHITRAASANANLSGISITSATLLPAFHANTADYNVTLGSEISSVIVTAIKSDTTATLRIDSIEATNKLVTLLPGETKNVVLEVTAQDGATTKTYRVNITREAQRVTGIDIDKSSLRLAVGDVRTLIASIIPADANGKNIVWSSDNRNIASVNEGIVRGESPGIATITATSEDGRFSDTCSITVTPGQYTITATANISSYGKVSGGGVYKTSATVKLTATPKPGYRFIRWIEGSKIVSNSAAYTFKAAANRSLKAEFGKAGVPSSISAVSAGYNSIKVSWGTGMGASGYLLYRATSSSGTYSLIATTSSASYTNTGLSTGKKYYYKVCAYITAGSSKMTGNFSAITSAVPIPTQVVGIKAAMYYPTSIKVSWSAVSGRSGYELERSTSPTSGFKAVKSTTSTYYKNTGLVTNTKYYYRVRAYRKVGRAKVYGPYSAVVSDTPRLAKVTGLKASVSSATKVKISWKSVSGKSGYEILRSTSPTSGFTVVGKTTRTYWYNSNVTPNTAYYYKVRAYRTVSKAKKYGEESDAASVRPVFATVSGAKAAMYSVTSVKVTWKSVSGRKGYAIYRSDSPDGEFKYIGYTTRTYYINKKLVPNKTYYYRIRAYVMVGKTKYYSGYSNTASAMPTLATVSGAKASMRSVTSIKVMWNKVSSRKGYAVYRSDSPEGEYSYIGYTTRTYYYNKNLAPNKTYYYRIRAYVTIGKTKYYSGYSNTASAAPILGSTTRVTVLKRSATSSKVAWKPVSGRSGYEILRSTSQNGKYSVIGSTTRTYYYDKRCVPNMTYYYKVRAYVKVKGARHYSLESDAVGATTA